MPLPEPAAQVRKAIERIKAAKAAYWAAERGTQESSDAFHRVGNAMDSWALQVDNVAALLDKWEPVRNRCAACKGVGRVPHPSGVLLERCSSCEGAGAINA